MADYLKAFQLWGLKGTLRHLYRFRQIKFGTQVGVDEFGNKYFENLELPYGQHRWIEPAVFDCPNLTEASLIPPKWHGWLHYTHDRIPSDSVPERTGNQTIPHSDAPQESKHYNMEHTRKWRPNPTLQRQRGYGVDHHFAKAGFDDFYAQPGNLVSPIYRQSGPKVESWNAAPSEKAVGSKANKGSKEPWEIFFEQRKKMNEQKK